ncbi:MAG: pyridoxal-phosphate dependent enzyme [Bacteroidia bacterium]|nr:pyridoxal-phosphate dependent enzyme [Bacteroidia bacterium]
MYYNNILETIGNTPLVKLNKLTKNIKGTILVKIESFNPGNSIKDRMAIKMIEDAEASGVLKPGGTVIEGTSGNTGMGLALACIVKGYKLICTMSDKQSKEKMDILRAVGAEVIVCPTNVGPDDPRSYYSVAKKLNETIPNSFYPNQYDNTSNTAAHYETNGPEIWEQTEGKITHLIVGVGTGGTISGTGKYLKEKNPNIKLWGIDTYGSVFKKFHETGEFDESEIYPYITEGIGEDILPKNVDFSIIDHFEKVSDKDGALMTRDLARLEGVFAGNSAGSAVAGLMQLADKLKDDDVVVIILHDHGSRYVGKMFNDDWMRDRGFLEKNHLTVRQLVSLKSNEKLITIKPEETLADAINKITQMNISQMPVIDNAGKIVGTLCETPLFSDVIKNPDLKSEQVQKYMQDPLKTVKMDTSVEELSQILKGDNNAVLVEDESGTQYIITKHDIVQAIAV